MRLSSPSTVGLVYALADRRLELGPRGVRASGVAAVQLLLTGIAVGLALFFGRVYHAGWFGDQWRAFKHAPTSTGSSHLLVLGSYRYDIWRVALHESADHPLAGIGSRGFGPAYLEKRHSPDTPARAHSVELDALSELGIVGLALLVAVLVLPLPPIVSRMRARDPAATAAFAGGAYWLVHASADWIWTVPACGLPFWLLLGAGGSGGDRRPLAARAALPAAAVAVVVAVVAFVPPWLSARLTDRGDFRWAKRLDPLSVDPYVAEGTIKSLEEAVLKQPRAVEVRFDLGQAYLRAGQRRRARAALPEAKRLDPRDPRILLALKNLPRRPIRSS